MSRAPWRLMRWRARRSFDRRSSPGRRSKRWRLTVSPTNCDPAGPDVGDAGDGDEELTAGRCGRPGRSRAGAGRSPSRTMRSSTRPRRSPSRSTSALLTTLDRCRISMAIRRRSSSDAVRAAAPNLVDPCPTDASAGVARRAWTVELRRAGVGPAPFAPEAEIRGRLIGHDLPRWATRVPKNSLAALVGDPGRRGSAAPTSRSPRPARRPRPGPAACASPSSSTGATPAAAARASTPAT